MHGYRVPHAHEGFIENVKGDCHQRKRIDKGSQHAGPMVAKGLGGAGRTGLNEDSNPGEQQGQQVRYVMPRFRKQGQTVRPNSSKKSNQDIGKGGRKGITQSLGAERSMCVRVPMAHTLRVYRRKGFDWSLSILSTPDENLDAYIRMRMLNMSMLLELLSLRPPDFLQSDRQSPIFLGVR